MGSLEKANVDDPLTKETILEKEKRMCSKKTIGDKEGEEGCPEKAKKEEEERKKQ